MSVKTTGAEWNRYYQDKQAWPDGSFYEDQVLKVNGELLADDYFFDGDGLFDDSVKIKIISGFVFAGYGEKEVSLVEHFKQWRKSQATSVIVVECPKDKVEQVEAAVKKVGGKVIR